MLIKHTGIFRELRLSDLTSQATEPPIWQFKTFYDAATYGVELIWPYEDFDPINQSAEFCSQIADQLYAIQFDTLVSTMSGYNLLVLPHHTWYLDSSHMPMPICQMIESDWWPGRLELIFKKNACIFKQNQPFAQAIVTPKREHQVRIMTFEEEAERTNAKDFLESHKQEYITRSITNPGYETQDNAYERLTQMERSGSLPKELKPKTSRAMQFTCRQ